MDKASIKFNDDFVYHEIFELNVYGLHRDDIENAAVLDLGGHYGLFALFCANYNAKQILSIEPNHNNLFKYLENTKDIPSTKVICAAVSSKKDLITTIDNMCGSSRTGMGEQLVATISFETIFNLLDKNANLVLKIDVEGAEYDILYGTDPEILKKFKIIVMEAHNYNPETLGNEAEKLKQYMFSLGYIMVYMTEYWSTEFNEVKYDMAPAYSYKFIKYNEIKKSN